MCCMTVRFPKEPSGHLQEYLEKHFCFRDWIKREVVSEDITKDGNLTKISQRLLHKSDLPQFEPVNLNLDSLMEEGDRLVYEQEMVNNLRLSDDYIIKQHGSGSMLGFSG